jgi:hypothetical protein
MAVADSVRTLGENHIRARFPAALDPRGGRVRPGRVRGGGSESVMASPRAESITDDTGASDSANAA